MYALDRAADLGLVNRLSYLPGALQFVGDVTDPATGRVGYDAPGSWGARLAGVNEDYRATIIATPGEENSPE